MCLILSNMYLGAYPPIEPKLELIKLIPFADRLQLLRTIESSMSNRPRGGAPNSLKMCSFCAYLGL